MGDARRGAAHRSQLRQAAGANATALRNRDSADGKRCREQLLRSGLAHAAHEGLHFV